MAARRALQRLRDDAWGTCLSVVVIAGAITLPLLLVSLVESARQAASRLATDPVANVYLKAGADEAAGRALEKLLRGQPGVATVRFVSREQALLDLRKVGHLSELLAALDTNPLPHALVLRLENREPSELAALKGFLASQPAVEDVSMDFEWAERIRRASVLLQSLAWAVSAALGVAVLFVIGNTTRLQILSQRDEIQVCRLIGASQAYVRRPLLYHGAIQGTLAGLLAGGITLAVMRSIAAEVRQLTASYGGFEMIQPDLPALIAVSALAGIMGWLGAWVSAARHLRATD
ncbi:MAG: ABC transporter permease [Betaproteobacteria bacterium]|nr:ABC transporter permease [Betaproteobacteria bacterium]